ncbi:MAG: PDZ domain-containing protein [Bacteroidota bacterium]|nr:PDZ domain-containing protein [Bacteroidota bacterium]
MKVEINRKGEKKIVEVVVGKVKTPKTLAFSYGLDEPDWTMKPKIPKLPEKFNVRIFTEREICGLKFQPLTKQLGEYFGTPNGKGVLIAEVEKGSDAEKAGFKAGDVITKVDNNSIVDVDELHQEISDVESKEIPFEIIRNGKSMKISMKIEEEENEEDEEEDWSSSPP